MSRPSFRPRPLDIHRKLPILKSIKDFEDDETPTSTRIQMLRLVAEADNETQVHQVVSKKTASEIPTPEYVIVDTYERDYSPTFNQPTSYLRARGVRSEIGEFVEYDLDNEDEDWVEELNRERKLLPAEKFETIVFKLEVLDHRARERAGVITPTIGAPIPVLLTFDAAVEALQALSIKYGVFQSIYNYWKEKRERWEKPILRHLQPPPPVSDTNPYNVFRPREKAHRFQTRRMQRRENNMQSFEKLREVRRNLEQAKDLLGALIKREEKKRQVIESQVCLQRIQLKYKDFQNEIEDSFALPGMPSFLSKFASSEDKIVISYDIQPVQTHVGMKQDLKRKPVPYDTWLHKMDPVMPVLLFTKPLDEAKLGAAGIVPPAGISVQNHGRIGRGGRIIFDRWNPLMH